MASGKGRLWVTAIIAVAVVMIAAVIVLYPHETTVLTEGDGKVTPSGNTVIRFTEALHLEIVPGEDTVAYVYVDEVLKAQDVTSYDFRVSALDFDKHTIEVVFQKVTPPEPEKEFTLSVTSEGEGAVTPSGETRYAEGTVVTVKATPGSGNVIGDIIIDGVSAGPGGSLQVRMNSDHDVKVVFRPVAEGDIPVTISVNVDLDIVVETLGATPDYGEVIPSGTVYVAPHGSLTITVVLNPGFEMKDITVDGISYGAVTERTITDITKSVDVRISIVKKVEGFIIKASAGTGGSIFPSGDVKVEKGKDMTFSFTPTSGYKVSTLTIDGKTVALTSNSYTFTDVQSAHTIAVTFQSTGGSGGGSGGGGGVTKTLIGISITQYPTKLLYDLDEEFSSEGLEITATYNVGSPKIVTSECRISYEPFTTIGQKTITISYTEDGITKTCTQVVTVADSSGFTVVVTELSGIMVDPSGSIIDFNEPMNKSLSDFSFKMTGIVPGVIQTAKMTITNDTGSKMNTYLCLDFISGTELAQQILLNISWNGCIIDNKYISEIATGENLFVKEMDDGESIDISVTMSFPHASNNNDVIGKSLSFTLSIKADGAII